MTLSGRTGDYMRRAETLFPGQSQLLSKRADQFAPGLWPGYYSRASGTTIWDLDGRAYLDMSIGGIGATEGDAGMGLPVDMDLDSSTT